MAVKQISVFVQNEKGALSEVLATVGAANIELRALSIADTKDFGILRIITDNEQATEAVLKENGYICNITDVVAVPVEDTPGSLARLVELLTNADVEVEYLYAFATPAKQACVVMRVNDTLKAEDTLSASGIKLLTEADMKSMNI